MHIYRRCSRRHENHDMTVWQATRKIDTIAARNFNLSPTLGIDVISTRSHDAPPSKKRSKACLANTGDCGSILFVCTQILTIILILTMLVGVVLASYGISSVTNKYYVMATPYFEEARDRSFRIIRNIESSSALLNGTMGATHDVAAVSLPALATTLNETTAMVSRLQHLAMNPSLKISVV